MAEINEPRMTALSAESAPHRAASYALIAFFALIVAHPLLVKGASCGHDFDFHLQSWLAVAGNWYPHWIAGANYGAGEPRFLFYPPASWLLGTLLGKLIPWSIVPAAFTWIALSASGLTARHMARQWMAPTAATVTGCLYLSNPYLLFTGFERTAYGELLAAVWLPLLLLFTLRPANHWRTRVVPLTLVIAALWLTNAPAAVMGCYLAVFSSFFAGAVRTRERTLQFGKPLTSSLSAIALGTALAGFYVYPAWYEQRWVQIARANASGMRVEDSFLFGHTGEPFHDQVLRTASWLAVSILAAAAVGAALSYRRAAAALWRALVATCAAILLLLLPVSLSLWNHLPQLHFLQFPWRWLLVAGLSAATLLAMNVRPTWKLRPIALGLIAWAFGSSLWAATQFWQSCDEEDNVQAQLQIGDAGFEGTDEYTARAADNGEIQQGLPPVRLLRAPDADEGDDSMSPNPPWRPGSAITGSFAVSRWLPEHKDLVVITSEPGYAVLRLNAYPAWRVRKDGRACGAGCLVAREDGLLTLAIPRGRTRIEADFSTTPDRELGGGLSLVAALALAAAAWRPGAKGTRGKL